eukprot:2772393-Prorocentrum_lima.AAC.1
MVAQAPPPPLPPANATGTGSMTQDWLQAIQAGLQTTTLSAPPPLLDSTLTGSSDERALPDVDTDSHNR